MGSDKARVGQVFNYEQSKQSDSSFQLFDPVEETELGITRR